MTGLTVLLCKQMKIYSDEDSGVVYSWNKTGILNIDLNNTNLDNNFDEDPASIILITLLTWHIRFEKCKTLK